MRHWILISSLMLVIASCTKIDVDEDLPSWETLQPQTMETSLDRIHIIADPTRLDDMMRRFNQDIEVSTDVVYYNYKGELLFEKTGNIEIKGAGSAAADMKPLGITFDTPFNNGSLKVITPQAVAPSDHLELIQNVRLRNSGQDFGITMLKDLAYSEFALRAGMDLELKYGKPLHVFINGKYYGLHNIRTENDRVAISHLLQTDTSSITRIKMDDSNKNLEYREGDLALAESLIRAIKNEDAYALEQLLDIDNFLDYIIFEDYVGNIDWPHNNARAYSVNGSKFRFLLYDLDLAAFRTKNPILPEMEYKEDHISEILQILLEDNPEFEARLHERQEMWYQAFSPELFNSVVDELADKIDTDIEYLIARRGFPQSTLQWRLNLEQLKRDFERTDHFNRKKYKLN
ncbi:CotH kinase family protein [bacterium SCSIO 12643]|nr:CotH kinase family protein [bacterium SCSIO 12643]